MRDWQYANAAASSGVTCEGSVLKLYSNSEGSMLIVVKHCSTKTLWAASSGQLLAGQTPTAVVSVGICLS